MATSEDLVALANNVCEVVKRSKQVRQVLLQAVLADVSLALLKDDKFKQSIIFELSREVALNQEVQQVQIREPQQGTSRNDQNLSIVLPESWFGVQAPTCLEPSLQRAMKDSMNAYMTVSFGRVVDWTRNRSTTWESLQAGDPFVLGGLLAHVFIHSEFWRTLFTISRPQTSQVALPTVEHLQLWFSAQPVARKWAEKLVLPLFTKLRMNTKNKLKMRRLRQINPEKYLKKSTKRGQGGITNEQVLLSESAPSYDNDFSNAVDVDLGYTVHDLPSSTSNNVDQSSEAFRLPESHTGNDLGMSTCAPMSSNNIHAQNTISHVGIRSTSLEASANSSAPEAFGLVEATSEVAVLQRRPDTFLAHLAPPTVSATSQYQPQMPAQRVRTNQGLQSASTNATANTTTNSITAQQITLLMNRIPSTGLARVQISATTSTLQGNVNNPNKQADAPQAPKSTTQTEASDINGLSTNPPNPTLQENVEDPIDGIDVFDMSNLVPATQGKNPKRHKRAVESNKKKQKGSHSSVEEDTNLSPASSTAPSADLSNEGESSSESIASQSVSSQQGKKGKRPRARSSASGNTKKAKATPSKAIASVPEKARKPRNTAKDTAKKPGSAANKRTLRNKS